MSTSRLRLGVLQLSPRPGALRENFQQLEDFLSKEAHQADLWVAPELCLTAYPARDAWSLVALQDQEEILLESCAKLSEKFKIGLCLGHTQKSSANCFRPLYNMASIWDCGKKIGSVIKQKIPNYDIFDEARFFEEGEKTPRNPITFRGTKIGVHICEESWMEVLSFGKGRKQSYQFFPEFSQAPELLINLSASPWTQGKSQSRKNLLQSLQKHFQCPILYANAVGLHDDVILDGHSLYLENETLLEAPRFKTGAFPVSTFTPETRASATADYQELRQALVFGIQDFFKQANVNKAVLGISGGIDSALVASLVCEAIGPQNLLGFCLSSKHTSQLSRTLSLQLANQLGFPLEFKQIEKVVEAFEELGVPTSGLPAENLQSRVRGNYLMSQANAHQAFLLATGNKSELAMGYSTLYGDLAGALCPIGDLWKSEVFALSHLDPKIPKEIIQRPPTAELAPGQKDSDSLPEYEQLDAFLELYVEGQLNEERIEMWRKLLAPKHTPEALIQKMHSQEFKRFQAPPILKTHLRSFGTGWRFPLFLKGFKNVP